MNGALNTTLILALLTAMALRPPMPRHSSPFNLQFALGWWINEMPFLGLAWLLAGTVGTLAAPRPTALWWWLVAGLTAVDAAALTWIALRARSARPALAAALCDGYGPDAAPQPTRPPWWRFVLPIISWRPDVRRVRNQRYGPARRGNRLDLYVSRRHRAVAAPAAPIFVYVHGGAFVLGTKILGAHPLLHRLAAQGWVCASIDYRLRRADYADQLSDVRAALNWIRAHAPEYGADPGAIVLAGGSSGAHLAATAALTAASTAKPVRGVVGLYGYYGRVGSHGAPASPGDCISPEAPPFLLIHGTQDTLVLHRDAREFADRLRAVSRQPVVYAELPGTQHNFDYFHSPRCHRVAEAVARFGELALSSDSAETQNADADSNANTNADTES